MIINKKLSFLLLLMFFCVSCTKSNPNLPVKQKLPRAITAKIIGGTPVEAGDWKGAVALTDQRTGRYFCTGVLVTRELVLTAAHCLGATRFASESEIYDNLKVYFGSGEEGGNFVGQYGVKLARVHPSYRKSGNPDVNTADIAFLKLDHPVGEEILDRDLIPLLVEPSALKAALEAGKYVNLVGFGNRRELGYADFESGEAPDRGVKYEIMMAVKRIQNDQLCWDGISGNGHYSGDSGGPVYAVDKDKRWKLVAVVMGSNRGAGEGFDILISPYITWIQEASGIHILDIPGTTTNN